MSDTILTESNIFVKIKVLLRRGSAYESSGQLPLAVADMESVLLVDPSSTKASEVICFSFFPFVHNFSISRIIQRCEFQSTIFALHLHSLIALIVK
jgi:hypothetical protein